RNYSPHDPSRTSTSRTLRHRKAQEPGWRDHLLSIKHAIDAATPQQTIGRPAPEMELIYSIDVDTVESGGKLVIDWARRERKTNGEWGKIKNQRLYSSEIVRLQNAADRRAVSILFGAPYEPGYGYSYYADSASRFTVPATLWEMVLPLLCGTGRLFLQGARSD